MLSQDVLGEIRLSDSLNRFNLKPVEQKLPGSVRLRET